MGYITKKEIDNKAFFKLLNVYKFFSLLKSNQFSYIQPFNLRKKSKESAHKCKEIIFQYKIT